MLPSSPTTALFGHFVDRASHRSRNDGHRRTVLRLDSGCQTDEWTSEPSWTPGGLHGEIRRCSMQNEKWRSS